MEFLTRILDASGRPFVLSDDQQTGTAKVGFLRQHYSTHPSMSLTPARAAALLKAAEDGDLMAQCELAEDMEEKDLHLAAELGKRRRAVQSLPWKITPPRNPTKEEQYDADMVTEILTDATWFNDCLFDATDAVLKGFSCQEIEWEQVDGLTIPKTIEFRDAAWFQTHPQDRNQLRLRDGSHEGQELWPFGWVVHVAKSKSGYLARMGLVRSLVWAFIFKNYSVRDLAEFLEIYGMPIRLGKYPAGSTEKEKQSLLRAVMSVGHNAGGIFPRGMDIELKNAIEGSSDPYMAFVTYWDLCISKVILGGTLTSQADGATSTNALGNVHERMADNICDSDALQLAPTITRDIVHPIVALNGRSFSSLRRLCRFEFDLSAPEDLTAYSTALPLLAGIGMKIPVQWAHEKLQIPMADDSDEVLKPAPQPEAPAFLSAVPRGYTALAAAPSVSAPDAQKAIAAMPGAVSGDEWQAVTDPILVPIIAAVQSGGMEAAKLRAAELYAELDDEQLTDMLSRAMWIAETWGRLNANAG
ncbi:Mu-like prophage FluMu protein gp29 [Leminorella grimontii]|uniref:Mu-like prophage FluMu protein gp29 n=1 Tax=Leminorella grimontii TaxID=82981 RepID=A0AAV5N9H6_9GAMM|nr:DUF935 domain-containing protein [Leminorella grimontii]KFC92458.1 gp29 family Mu-like phage protein [Leminorella grimontii ATCC 33999 = DSM 5078]GKX57623.1 Mu-like prophage FluMu protein gp29 [Leminorella grimontii]VFS55841.1 Mu-like prophage protein gp29 [Leminorella grimontii]